MGVRAYKPDAYRVVVTSDGVVNIGNTCGTAKYTLIDEIEYLPFIKVIGQRVLGNIDNVAVYFERSTFCLRQGSV